MNEFNSTSDQTRKESNSFCFKRCKVNVVLILFHLVRYNNSISIKQSAQIMVRSHVGDIALDLDDRCYKGYLFPD